jgi:tRNA A37 threonylcarbamoyladenosine dehydratase
MIEGDSAIPFSDSEAFERLIQLIGLPAFQRLRSSRVLVIGLGGVGGHAAEALVRSGLGFIGLLDPDCVHPSNLNRQLVALHSEMGRPKVQLLTHRLRDIYPGLEVVGAQEKVDHQNLHPWLTEQTWDYIIDAFDEITAKAALLAHAYRHRCPLVSSMAAGARMDPGAIVIKDLNATREDSMARVLRKLLKSRYGLPRTGKWRLPVVISTEVIPSDRHRKAEGPEPRVSGGGRRKIPVGTVQMVTAAFGLRLASHVFNYLISKEINRR